MIANHVHHALAQVRALRIALERHHFHGFSGRARMASGALALAAAAFLSHRGSAAGIEEHAAIWATVFVGALTMNLGALLYWFLNDPDVDRQWTRLTPALDVVPPLLVGGFISISLAMYGHGNYLFGVWMSLYGVANFSARHILPTATAHVGLFYIAAGTVCLFAPGIHFTNPWPMGIVFAIGEMAGGMILQFDQTRWLASADIH